MRVLVGWDDPAEAELLSLYLNIGDNEVAIATDSGELLKHAEAGRWDAVLLALALAEHGDAEYELFQKLRRGLPDTPIIGACHPEGVFRLARFMTSGMRSYMLRDKSGDFVFLVLSALESAVEGVRAEHEQKIAERLREEMESVRKLQESIIPHNLYCPKGYRICARYEPSQIHVVGGRPVVMAGGDYYNVFTLDDGSIVLLVGDASGHGMKACMSIITMHTLIRMIPGQQYQDAAAFVTEVNRRLCEQSILTEEGGFITLFYGVLHADRHEFHWASAGHPIPLLHDLEQGHVQPIGSEDDTGLPLGIVREAEYRTLNYPIPPCSRLMLYTDGLIDAFPEGEHHRWQDYGVRGAMETLKRSVSVSLDEALRSLFDDSHAFTQGSGRHDDTSVVLLERERGPELAGRLLGGAEEDHVVPADVHRGLAVNVHDHRVDAELAGRGLGDV